MNTSQLNNTNSIDSAELKILLKIVNATGQICSVSFIQGYSAKGGQSWLAWADSMGLEELTANSREHIKNGTISSRSRMAKPFAKTARSIKFGGSEYVNLDKFNASTTEDFLSFDDKLELGYVQPLDTHKLQMYLRFNGVHTLEQCKTYAKANGFIYARAYTDKATGEVFNIGDPKPNSCVCKAVPFRRINLNSILQLKTAKAVFNVNR